MLMKKEHYDLMSTFERQHSGRFDKEDKALWPNGIIYQDGRVNELFLAFRRGHAYAEADMRADVQNIEASRDGYRDDARVLHAALTGVLNDLKDRAEDGVMDISQGVLEVAETALERTNALQGESHEQMGSYARAAVEANEQRIINAFLERTGQYVTNDASREAAIQAAVEADRRDHFRDVTKMVPSDEEIEARVSAALDSLGWCLDSGEWEEMVEFARALLERCGQPLCNTGTQRELQRGAESQPAASAEPVKEKSEFRKAVEAMRGEPVTKDAAQHSAPDGWKLVPEKPTAEMSAAAAAESKRWSFRGGDDGTLHYQIFRAMLDSAPFAAQAPTIKESLNVAQAQPVVNQSLAIDKPLPVFSSGIWIFKETGETFTEQEMDGAAFAVYRAALAQQPSDQEPMPLSFAADWKDPPASPSAQDREDAERYRWATACEDNADELTAAVISCGGDQAAINERVDRAAKGE